MRAVPRTGYRRLSPLGRVRRASPAVRDVAGVCPTPPPPPPPPPGPPPGGGPPAPRGGGAPLGGVAWGLGGGYWGGAPPSHQRAALRLRAGGSSGCAPPPSPGFSPWNSIVTKPACRAASPPPFLSREALRSWIVA